MKIAPQHQTRAAATALVLAALFWSGNFIAGRAIRDDIAPLELNTIRWIISLGVLLPFTFRGLITHRKALLQSWLKITLLGFTGIAAFHTMAYEALSLTAAVNCLLITALAPVATVAGGMVWNGFRPTVAQITGLLVSLVGAIVLILSGGGAGASLFAIDAGKVWMLGAVLIWAWYTLILRSNPVNVPQTVSLVASIIVALVMMLALLLVRGIEPPQMNRDMVLAILYIAILPSALGFLLWSYGISVIGPEQGGQFIHLMPIFGSILAVLFLGESITLSLVAGAVCVIAGIVLVNRRDKTLSS
ncbi:DMT family transporter [Cognatishimia activa]|uniref:Putative DMT superfamily transporter inner membrane protein n=1 Tax=Cognatishimia activa TaxID=1715691 RepID=A0A0N7MC50_9RHOB|nr:DMT family transporter [Cognatishimia activa]CUJ29773.1 putative DMT superfamily transporter inner membrane protein [Cognatishimia activa]CUK27224.1 putative DMT superfamily transporter inner membrane protein [Cognatishimia activa]